MLSLLEGDEFVRGILEPAGLTMEDLARPSIDPRQKISIPPPPTEGPIPSKRAPRWEDVCQTDRQRVHIGTFSVHESDDIIDRLAVASLGHLCFPQTQVEE